MCKRPNCGCDEQRSVNAGDAAQIEMLSDRVRWLTEQLAEHIATDDQDRDLSRRALTRAADLLRIIGGKKVTPGAFPECCLIGNASGQGAHQHWFCTGTLIHPRVVVSAEHCIQFSNGVLNPNSIAIGVDDQNDVTADNIIRVAKIHRHPSEDLALLVLHQAAEIDPIARASQAETAAASQVHLVGFGNSDAGGMVGFGSKREVQVNMDVVRQGAGDDLAMAEAHFGFDSNTEFVAGRKGSAKDSCRGDSGGPAYIHVDSVRKLAGATSRATDEANNVCGDGGVYVRMDAVADWIDGIIDELS